MTPKSSTVAFVNFLIKKKYFYHYLFWATLFISMSFDLSTLLQVLPYTHYFLLITVRIMFIMALSYLNLFVLIPLLFKNHKIDYFILLLTSIILFAICNIFYNRLFPVPELLLLSKLSFGNVITYSFVSVRLLFLATILQFTVDRHLQQKKINELKILNLESEIKRLRFQLNPHFLFNTLNNLQSLIVNQSPKAKEIVESLSDRMDYMLYESNEKFISLSKELNYIKNHIYLERIGKGNSENIQLKMNGSTEDLMIAPFILLPLIENSFKHGFHKMGKKGFVHILIHIEQGYISVSVNNNYPLTNTLKHEGVGLENLVHRLELLYKDKYTFQTSSKEGIYTTNLNIKLL